MRWRLNYFWGSSEFYECFFKLNARAFNSINNIQGAPTGSPPLASLGVWLANAFCVRSQGPYYIKSIYYLVSHCLPCNSTHNFLNNSIGIMEAFSNVNIVAKLLAKLQEVESSCRCTYNGVGGVIMQIKTTLGQLKQFLAQ